MCGHFGIFGNLCEDDKSIFEYGLTLTQMTRGRHSVGVCRLDKDYNTLVAKTVGLFPNLFHLDVPLFDEQGFIEGEDLRGLLGHGRHATVGEVNVENAHPFEFDNLIGFHNGTFTEYEVNRFDKDYKKVDSTDSYALFKHLSENGGDLTKIADKLSGAMACAVWDKTTDTLRLWRNKDRPMVLVYSADMSKVIYCSEVYHAYYAVQRYGDLDEWIWVKNADHETHIDKLYSIRYNSSNNELEVEKTPLTFFQYPATVYSPAYGQNWTGPKTAQTQSPAQKAAQTLIAGPKASSATGKTGRNVVPLKNNLTYFGNPNRFWEIFEVKDVDIAFTTPEKLRSEHGGLFVFDNVMERFVYYSLYNNLLWVGFGFDEKMYDKNSLDGLRPTKFFLGEKEIVGLCPMTVKHPLGQMMEAIPEATPKDNLQENWVRASYNKKDKLFSFYMRPDTDVGSSSYYLTDDNPYNRWMVKQTTHGGETWMTHLPRETMARDKFTVVDLWTYAYDRQQKNLSSADRAASI